ncbi:cysteine and glycine-rich 1-like [Paramuricea clavata]|uniref:Cysteine and glycine-rich 1-like n=1 Tax=Paramuricea clavata TaxID=317549 RepID=A0A6S7FP78_PARCT|nr:cysteine and glycine-rich 1-like [Paramuricea clavata]
MSGFGGGVRCKVCGKAVYHAERAEGSPEFHKMCLKCSLCNKLLDSTTVTMHEVDEFDRGLMEVSRGYVTVCTLLVVQSVMISEWGTKPESSN